MVKLLTTRLNSAEYLQSLQEVDHLDREPFVNFKEARREVLQAEGQERIRTWMIYHIMEPKFDNPNSLMPNMGLSRAEATAITDYLLQEQSFTERTKNYVMPYLPAVLLPRHLLFAFGIGLIAGILGYISLLAIIHRFHRRRRNKDMVLSK
jgi:hypothetical protein